MILQLPLNGRTLTVKDVVDREALSFEERLCAQGVRLLLPQSCLWLKNCSHEFRLFQFTDRLGCPAGQMAVQIHRPRRAKWYVHGSVASFNHGCINHSEERWALMTIPRVLRETMGLSRLRIHFYHENYSELCRAGENAESVGYALSPSLSYEKTLYYDLRPQVDELMAQLDKKIRARVRHRTRSDVEIVRLTDKVWAPVMQRCLDSAFTRHGGLSQPFDFETYLNISEEQPDRVIILGLFIKERPGELLAYTIDARHGNLVEGISSGSMADPQLRKLNFNYFLIWEMVQWAKQHGVHWYDLGGVTDGHEGDSLASISSFKRNFTKDVRTVGREYVITTRTELDGLFRGLNLLREALRS